MKMNQIPKTAMEEALLMNQIPKTAMEEALLRKVIELEMPKEIRSAVGNFSRVGIGKYLSGGWFELIYYPENFDPLDLRSDRLEGRVRVVERIYPASEAFRVMIIWEFPAQFASAWKIPEMQSNCAPYLPIIWEASISFQRSLS